MEPASSERGGAPMMVPLLVDTQECRISSFLERLRSAQRTVFYPFVQELMQHIAYLKRFNSETTAMC
jgi:hypothetical protein